MSNGSSPASEPSAAIASYRPSGVSEAAGAFARGVVGKAAPQSPARARALLFAASRLAAFGESVGLQLEGQVLLQESVIERFILQGERTLSGPTRRTLHTNLRALARVLQAHPCPAPVGLPRERAKPPYSQAQIASYLALAGALSTTSRQMRSAALICLGAGAGVIGSELRHLRGCDVMERYGGVAVAVAGPRARLVPVLARFHAPLLTAAALAGEGYLLGGKSPERRNLSDALARSLSGDSSLPRLHGGRLRSTWLWEVAGLIGLQAFMAAAGVRCSQRLGDIAAQLPALEETEMVALLGGSA